MLPGKLDDWEDEVSITDITLATAMTRRKSMRRSMIPSHQFGSLISRDSPKLKRKSIGVFMRDASESPVISSTQSHSLSFDSKVPRRDESAPISPRNQSTPQPVVDETPIPVSSKKFDILTKPGPLTHSLLQKSPPRVLEPQSSLKSNGCMPYCMTVDDMVNNYEREISEWPKFLSSLEEKAISPFQPSFSQDEIMKEPILRPFVQFIFPDHASSPSVEELQRRTKMSYSKIMVGLVRTKMAQEKLRCRMSLLRESKLKRLLPRLAQSSNPVSVRDLSAFVSCLQETDALP